MLWKRLRKPVCFDCKIRGRCKAGNKRLGAGDENLLEKKNMGRNEWHPVAPFSKKMSPAEYNYDVYDKQLLVIIRALEKWHTKIQSTPGRSKS